jgi:hypothetical protein
MHALVVDKVHTHFKGPLKRGANTQTGTHTPAHTTHTHTHTHNVTHTAGLSAHCVHALVVHTLQGPLLYLNCLVHTFRVSMSVKHIIGRKFFPRNGRRCQDERSWDEIGSRNRGSSKLRAGLYGQGGRGQGQRWDGENGRTSGKYLYRPQLHRF